MAYDLSDIVEVQISKATEAIDTASFDIPLALVTTNAFQERVRVYTNLTGVGEDFATTDKAYVIASKLFGQDIKPSQILIGRRLVDDVIVTISSVADNTTYTVTINSTEYTIDSGVAATATSIVTALKDAFTASPVAGITVGGTTTLTVSAAAGVEWGVQVGVGMAVTNGTVTEAYTEALQNVTEYNGDWFWLVTDTHVKADILAIAAAIQGTPRLYAAATADTDVLTKTAGNVALALSDANYGATFLVYSATADTEYPEAAWVGSQSVEVPGSNDWNLKSAQGVTVSKLTETQKANLREQNCNFYIRKSGVEIFQDGNMCDGSPIDEAVFLRWLTARLSEEVFGTLVRSKKVPYDDAGVVIILNDIYNVMDRGVVNGGIAVNPRYTVTAPDILSISANQRAQRILGDFIIDFRLAGSIRRVRIVGQAFA